MRVKTGTVSAVIQPLTALRDVQWRDLYRRSKAWHEEEATAHEVSTDAIAELVLGFVILSVRLADLKGTPVKLAQTKDSGDTLREKFQVYLESEDYLFFRDADRAIQQYDRPQDPATAPQKPTDPNS